MKVKDLEPVLQETKEQIRTELINELIEWNDKEKFYQRSWVEVENKLRSLLPPETPEKIAERKAVEIMEAHPMLAANDSALVGKLIKQMLIEALLTDIPK